MRDYSFEESLQISKTIQKVVMCKLKIHKTVSRELIVNELMKSGLPKKQAESWHDIFVMMVDDIREKRKKK